MADYTKLNLRGVEDAAKKFGMPEGLESRFAREALELDNQGLTLFTLAPNFRIPFGHRHKEQEEVYVVVKGSARIKLDDEIVDLATWDAVRIPPAVAARRSRPGPDGAEVLAVGAPNVGLRRRRAAAGLLARVSARPLSGLIPDQPVQAGRSG